MKSKMVSSSKAECVGKYPKQSAIHRIKLIGVAIVLSVLCLAGNAARSGPALQEIETNRKVQVCIWPDYHSITFRNPKSGELRGIDIELSQKFAQFLNVQLDYVDSSFATLVPDLVARKCHVAMFGIAVTPERQQKLQFSQPYLRAGILAATTRNNPKIRRWEDIDTAGTLVAVQAGTYMEPVMSRALKSAELVVVRPPATRERELLSGRADVFMTDFPYTRRLLENENWVQIIAPPTPFSPFDYAYAIAPGDDALLAHLNRFVTQIRAGGELLAAAQRNGLESIVLK